MEPTYNSPKPTKGKTNIQDRVLKNPYTSIIGLALIGAGIYVLKMELGDTIKLASSGLLFVAGLVALGLKDKKDK